MERGSYRIWDMTQDSKTGNFFRAGRKMQVQKLEPFFSIGNLKGEKQKGRVWEMEKFLNLSLLLTHHIPLFQCMNLKGGKGGFFSKENVVLCHGEGGGGGKV